MVQNLKEEQFEWIKHHRENPPHRFAVQSRGGFVKHDTFQSIDDAVDYVFTMMKTDVLYINYIEICDMRTGLVWSPENLKYFYRHLNGMEF